MYKEFKISIVVVFSICLSSCSQGLVESLYYQAKQGDDKDRVTAFVMLSNMALNEDQIEEIKQDYNNEKNGLTKYYYEYLLAKRTQETVYIDRFIERSNKHIELLTENKTQWISVNSPFYEQLSFYSKTNDKALIALLRLLDRAEGAGLTSLTEDLADMHRMDAERFSRVLSQAGLQADILLGFMEDG